MSNVFLEVKCGVELDTDLNEDEAMEMDEAEIYEMFAEKFKQKPLDTYAKQLKKIKTLEKKTKMTMMTLMIPYYRY